MIISKERVLEINKNILSKEIQKRMDDSSGLYFTNIGIEKTTLPIYPSLAFRRDSLSIQKHELGKMVDNLKREEPSSFVREEAEYKKDGVIFMTSRVINSWRNTFSIRSISPIYQSRLSDSQNERILKNTVLATRESFNSVRQKELEKKEGVPTRIANEKALNVGITETYFPVNARKFKAYLFDEVDFDKLYLYRVGGKFLIFYNNGKVNKKTLGGEVLNIGEYFYNGHYFHFLTSIDTKKAVNKKNLYKISDIYETVQNPLSNSKTIQLIDKIEEETTRREMIRYFTKLKTNNFQTVSSQNEVQMIGVSVGMRTVETSTQHLGKYSNTVLMKTAGNIAYRSGDNLFIHPHIFEYCQYIDGRNKRFRDNKQLSSVCNSVNPYASLLIETGEVTKEEALFYSNIQVPDVPLFSASEEEPVLKFIPLINPTHFIPSFDGLNEEDRKMIFIYLMANEFKYRLIDR